MLWFMLGVLVGIWLSFHDWPATARKLRKRYDIQYRRRQKLLHPFLRDEKVDLSIWHKGGKNAKTTTKR